MNQNQKAVISGLWTIAGCVTVIGIALLWWDGNHMTEICTTRGYDPCVNIMNMRGAYLLVAGLVAVAATLVAERQLRKDDEIVPLIS